MSVEAIYFTDGILVSSHIRNAKDWKGRRLSYLLNPVVQGCQRFSPWARSNSQSPIIWCWCCLWALDRMCMPCALAQPSDLHATTYRSVLGCTLHIVCGASLECMLHVVPTLVCPCRQSPHVQGWFVGSSWPADWAFSPHLSCGAWWVWYPAVGDDKLEVWGGCSLIGKLSTDVA